MREPDRAVLELDHARRDGGLERVVRHARRTEELHRRGAERGREHEACARGVGEPREPGIDELLERLRHRKRLRGIEVRPEGTGELERVERIASGRLVDPQQRRAREDAIELVPEEHLDRTDAERAEPETLHLTSAKDVLERNRLGARAGPAREQDADSRLQAAQGERQTGRGRRVEPLEVVDGDHERRVLGENFERVADGDAERAWIDRLLGLFEQKRDPERPSARCRQRGQDVIENGLEEVSEPGEREPALGLGRLGEEHASGACSGLLDRGLPERRLPDPCLPVEHQRARRVGGTVEEGADQAELVFSPDDRPHARNDGRNLRTWQDVLDSTQHERS